jgi:hypothetical protein
MLTNINDPPQKGNSRSEQGNAIKLDTVVDHNHHIGYVDKLTDSQAAVRHGSGRKSCFSICYLTILKSYILLSS